MSAAWFYLQDGQQYGPCSSNELKALARSGQLRPDDYVWKEGMGEWIKGHAVAGLFLGTAHTLPPAPPQLRPPQLRQTSQPIESEDELAALTSIAAATSTVRRRTAHSGKKIKTFAVLAIGVVIAGILLKAAFRDEFDVTPSQASDDVIERAVNGDEGVERAHKLRSAYPIEYLDEVRKLRSMMTMSLPENGTVGEWVKRGKANDQIEHELAQYREASEKNYAAEESRLTREWQAKVNTAENVAKDVNRQTKESDPDSTKEALDTYHKFEQTRDEMSAAVNELHERRDADLKAKRKELEGKYQMK